VAFKKSTAWLRDSRLFGDRFNPIWRALGGLAVAFCLGLTIYYSLS